MTDLSAFVAGLPKAELHIHIEGSLEPELMFALARRNRVEIPFATVEDVRAAYDFSNLQDFLDIYYRGAEVLRSEEDFHDLAAAYFDRAAAESVVHAEIFFDPQTHVARGIPFGTIMAGLTVAVEAARDRHGMSAKLILCFLRHLDEEEAFATLKQAEPWLDRIEAVGLDSSELDHPPAKFARVFAAAGERGLKRVAHAGEEGPPDYVHQALDLLHVDRIDHGNRAMEDPDLVARLAREEMTLTVCPLSNLKLRVVGDMAAHPIDAMMEAGLRVTVNSDDPAYFGGTVNANYLAVAQGRGLGRDALATLARNSLLGAFVSEDRRAELVARLDSYLAEQQV